VGVTVVESTSHPQQRVLIRPLISCCLQKVSFASTHNEGLISGVHLETLLCVSVCSAFGLGVLLDRPRSYQFDLFVQLLLKALAVTRMVI
jgi:hypothetical protein